MFSCVFDKIAKKDLIKLLIAEYQRKIANIELVE